MPVVDEHGKITGLGQVINDRRAAGQRATVAQPPQLAAQPPPQPARPPALSPDRRRFPAAAVPRDQLVAFMPGMPQH
jgi:hypothetical protein